MTGENQRINTQPNRRPGRTALRAVGCLGGALLVGGSGIVVYNNWLHEDAPSAPPSLAEQCKDRDAKLDSDIAALEKTSKDQSTVLNVSPEGTVLELRVRNLSEVDIPAHQTFLLGRCTTALPLPAEPTAMGYWRELNGGNKIEVSIYGSQGSRATVSVNLNNHNITDPVTSGIKLLDKTANKPWVHTYDVPVPGQEYNGGPMVSIKDKYGRPDHLTAFKCPSVEKAVECRNAF